MLVLSNAVPLVGEFTGKLQIPLQNSAKNSTFFHVCLRPFTSIQKIESINDFQVICDSIVLCTRGPRL